IRGGGAFEDAALPLGRLSAEGRDAARGDALFRIGEHLPHVDPDDASEAAARGARAHRAVEAEHAGRGLAVGEVAARAMEPSACLHVRAALDVDLGAAFAAP